MYLYRSVYLGSNLRNLLCWLLNYVTWDVINNYFTCVVEFVKPLTILLIWGCISCISWDNLIFFCHKYFYDSDIYLLLSCKNVYNQMGFLNCLILRQNFLWGYDFVKTLILTWVVIIILVVSWICFKIHWFILEVIGVVNMMHH